MDNIDKSNVDANEDNINIDLIDGKFMDGKAHKTFLMKRMKKFLTGLTKKTRFTQVMKPKMVVVQVGDDGASTVYIKHKMRACAELGIEFEKMSFGNDVSEDKLISSLIGLNERVDVHGYIVQLPLPKHINVEKIVMTVDPAKDIDCFHPENVGRLLSSVVRFDPPTPRGIVHLLKEYGVEMRGKNVVIIGKSRIVGTPLALMLSMETGIGATVTLCDKWTEELDKISRGADVLIACAGVRELVRRETQIKKGCVLIDVGIHRVEVVNDDGVVKRRIVGDIAKNDGIVAKCKMMSPSPGGCGCLTVAYLCLNLIKAYVNTVGGNEKYGESVFCKDKDILHV